MRAMILAAGRGSRMGKLTDDTPKPLLKAGDRCLIEYAITQLVSAGIKDIVINVAYQGAKIKDVIGNGSKYQASIEYSVEDERLETGGGIVKALPMLGNDPFIVVSSDVISDFPISTLPENPVGLAHLVLVQNPDFHPQGDFGLRQNYIDMDAVPKYTNANIGVYRPELFDDCKPMFFPLRHVLFPAIYQHQVTGEIYEGRWFNIGTPQQLSAFSASLAPASD